MADLIKAKVWLLGKCDLCGTPIDRIERERTTVWHFHYAPAPAPEMPRPPAEEAVARLMAEDENEYRREIGVDAERPRAASVEPAPALAAPESGTGVREAHERSEAVELVPGVWISGTRQNGKTTAAIAAAVEAARPVHYRELADSLDHVHPEAARLIRSHVKDLEDNE